MKQKQYRNKFDNDLKNGPHQKKKIFEKIEKKSYAEVVKIFGKNKSVKV